MQDLEFIHIREVMRMTSLSKKNIYRMIGAGQFPRQVVLSARRVAWLKSDIAAWQVARLGGQTSTIAA